MDTRRPDASSNEHHTLRHIRELMHSGAARPASSLTVAVLAGLAAFPALIAPQQPISASDQRPSITAGGPVSNLNYATDLAAAYLEGACNLTGRFAYRVDSKTGRQSSSYDIVRHAGAIYALASYNKFRSD